MNINAKIMGLTGVSGAAAFIVIANNWKPFVEGVAAMPAMITALASGMPLGAGSYLLSQICTPLLYQFLDRWLPKLHTDRHAFATELFTLFAGVGITVAQQWGSVKGSAFVFPILLGALAGLSGPLIVKGIRSFFKGECDESTKPSGVVGAIPKSD